MSDINEANETNMDFPTPLPEEGIVNENNTTEQNTDIQKDEIVTDNPIEINKIESIENIQEIVEESHFEIVIEDQKEESADKNTDQIETIDGSSSAAIQNQTEIAVPTLSLKEIKNIIEALLLVSDKPLTIQKIKELIELDDSKTIRAVISELKDEYDREERAFHILEVAGGYLIYTRDKFAPWIKKLIQSRSQKKLSPSLVETLAIIAYKQPVSRLEIEAIRGVGAGSAVKILMEKKLVRIVGKKEGIGKSLLYGTTKDFLIYFGLKSLEELPQLNELKEIMKGENTAP